VGELPPSSTMKSVPLSSVARSLAMDLEGEGVVVVIMHPGYVRTGLDSSTHGL
jgi:NAD(P)-dependent dehydrogenase (short-subunit alcohol dehydrogenase family)